MGFVSFDQVGIQSVGARFVTPYSVGLHALGIFLFERFLDNRVGAAEYATAWTYTRAVDDLPRFHPAVFLVHHVSDMVGCLLSSQREDSLCGNYPREDKEK